MTQTDFIRLVAHHAQMPQVAVAHLLKTAADVLAEALAAGEAVKFPGLGTFEAPVSAPRVMRLNLLANPETRTVGGKRRARFRPGRAFAAVVAGPKD